MVVERRGQIQLHKADGVLQFATFVLGADGATVGHGYVTLTDVLRTAQFGAVAGQATVRVLRHKQIGDPAPEINNLFAVGLHDHVRHDRSRAGSLNTLAATGLSGHHAHAARAVRLHSREVAKIRNVNIRVLRSLNDRLARFGLDLVAVYR